MARSADRVIRQIAVREDRVVFKGNVGAVRRVAARDRLAVVTARAAFGDHEIVLPVDLVEVRALRVLAAGAGPDEPPGSLLAFHIGAAFHIQLHEVDQPAILAVAAGVNDVHLAIVVEQQRRIGVHVAKPDRLGPRAARIARRHVKRALRGEVRRDHVEQAVVVAQRGRIDARRAETMTERQLAGRRQAVADELPVHEIAAVIDRHAGEILEGACDEVKIVAHPAEARIGREAADDRVFKRGAARRGRQGGRWHRKRGILHRFGSECRSAGQRGESEQGS